MDINGFLAGILSGINSVVNNYGWSIVVFTILIKLVLFPLDFKSRKSMRRMQMLQPEIAKLQKKYANDKEKLNQKTAELYRKEKINPMAGCLPMLLSMPILFAMFAAMRMIAQTELAKQAIDLILTGEQTNERWLWVKNLWMPDSPFAPTIANLSNLEQVPLDIWKKVLASLNMEQLSALANLGEGLAITQETISGGQVFSALAQCDVYTQAIQKWGTMPQINLFITNLEVFANPNGWFVLPLLAAASNFLITLFQPQAPASGENSQAASTNKLMKYFFPIFSLVICFGYNAGFSLYWVASNLIAGVQGYALTKFFNAQDKKAPSVIIGEGSLK